MSRIDISHIESMDREYGIMTRNDIMEDLQAYMDDVEDSLHRALEREQMWKDHCQELKKELAILKGESQREIV